MEKKSLQVLKEEEEAQLAEFDDLLSDNFSNSVTNSSKSSDSGKSKDDISDSELMDL